MEIMKRRVLAAFLAMILTCGVAFPGNAVYAAEVTETTVESDAAVEEHGGADNGCGGRSEAGGKQQSSRKQQKQPKQQ